MGYIIGGKMLECRRVSCQEHGGVRLREVGGGRIEDSGCSKGRPQIGEVNIGVEAPCLD